MPIVSVSTLSIEYEIAGSGDPVVVLLNGLQIPMSSWEKLTQHMNNSGTILLYNRLGVGASDPPSEFQDGITIASQLNGLLSELTLKTPVILVGHSIGGLYANLYARLYPADVGGVVLLESTHPDEPAYREANTGFFWRTLEKILNLKQNPIREDPNSEYNSVSTASNDHNGSGTASQGRIRTVSTSIVSRPTPDYQNTCRARGMNGYGIRSFATFAILRRRPRDE